MTFRVIICASSSIYHMKMRNLRPVAQTSIWSQLLHFENIQYGCQHYCSRASSLWANSWVPQEMWVGYNWTSCSFFQSDFRCECSQWPWYNVSDNLSRLSPSMSRSNQCFSLLTVIQFPENKTEELDVIAKYYPVGDKLGSSPYLFTT